MNKFLLALLILAPLARADEPAWRERALDEQAALAGPVWSRAWIRVPDNMAGTSEKPDIWKDSMSVTLWDVSGPVEIFVNGRSIARAHDIAADDPQRIKIPKGSFEKGAFNSIVIRTEGRVLSVAPVIAGYYDEVKLERPWQVATREPSAAELAATKETPAVAAYTEKDFHPGTTPMQANAELTRGVFVSPADALARLKTEDDLVVEELLHEPDVAQPTHVSFDERGRMWVAQYRQYPYPAGLKMISRDKFYRSKYDRDPPAPPNHTPGADIISVHEDRDGDGKYETSKRVLTGLNMANAVVRGHGGLWVMHTPYLLFYPDANGDDVPDRAPEVRLRGFGLEDTHSVANGLVWGPDGWLYGAQGSTTSSRVTRPDVDPANAPGVYIEGCMVWRYHPERKIYEIFCDGSGNTFGVGFDPEGRMFTGHNGGDTRGFHHVQEGQLFKQGKDAGKFGPVNSFSFGELPMMKSANPIQRFTHMTIICDGSAMPERLRGQFVAVDPLHHYVVAAERKVRGATFETADKGFPLKTDDPTFRPVYLVNAPDGSLVVADFREEYIAHGQNYQSLIDPDTGRIYRLHAKDRPLERDVNLSVKTTAQLVALLSHPNQWHRQTAVRLLAERNDEAAVPLLKKELEKAEAHPALEALWALHQMARLDEALALKSLIHPAAMVRAWTIRLLGDERNLPTKFAEQVVVSAATEPDAEVRCQMLSTAKRLPVPQALPLVRAVAMRTNDVADVYIPMMAWFVVEPFCASQREAVLALFDDAALWKSPLVRAHITPKLMRRFAESGTRQELIACAALLAKAPEQADRNALMRGFEEAFKGRAIPALPDELMSALAKSGRMTLPLRVRNGEAAAMEEALQLIANEKADAAQRLATIRIFGEVKHAPAASVLLKIATSSGSNELRVAACTALQSYEDANIGETIAKAWPELPAEVRAAALNLLASRATWSRNLLDAFVARKIPRAEFSPDIVARLRTYTDGHVREVMEKHFLAVAPMAREALRPRIEQVRKIITGGPGDAYRGEPLFMGRCGACHTLFHKGGKIGPNLTSYQRDDLGTMLVSVVDPNAEIREGFENMIVTTKDGRTLSGFLADQDLNVVVLRGFDGADISLRRADIAKMDGAGRSLMPEGILDGLKDAELRDLFAYLRQSQPIVK